MTSSRFGLFFVKKHVLCLLLLTLVPGSESTLASDWTYFFKNIFNTYNKNLFPKSDQGDILDVNISYTLNAITNFDEVGGVLVTVGYLTVEWTNELLTWTEKQKDTSDVITSTKVALSEVWHPPITLANSVNSLAELGSIKDNVDIRYDGVHHWTPAVILSSSCSSDPTYFPFDTQTCNLTFQSWDFAGEEINLTSPNTNVSLDTYNANEMWELTETSVDIYADDSHSYVVFTLTLKRIPLWFIINIVAPLTLLGFLNTFVFLTPIEEGRLGYGLAAFLTFSFFLTMIGDHLPKSADPMSLLSFYVVIQVLISGITSIISVFSLRLYVKTEDESVPRCLATFVGCICCMVCKRKDDDEDKKKKPKRASTVLDSGLGILNPDEKPFDEKTEVQNVSSSTRFGVSNVRWTPVDLDPVEETEVKFCCFVVPEAGWALVSTSMDYAFFVATLVTNIALGLSFLLPLYQKN